jgi:ribonuclease T1
MSSRSITRLLFLILVWALGFSALARQLSDLPVVDIAALPLEAQQTLVLIRRGGPFPYPRDGIAFGNYERLLPEQKRGYYREFTVKTPGVRGRGARRIIAGGDAVAPKEYFYTDDHYASFRRIRE